MEKPDWEKMGEAIAEKFRGKLAPDGTRRGPTPAAAEESTPNTLVEAPPKQPESTRSILNVPQSGSMPETVQVVALDLVLDSPFQPRCRDSNKKNLEELANNIAANGQTTAIIVTCGTGEFEGKYHVHSGHRRCAAIRLLGWKTVKAIVRDDLGEREARRLALMDNLGREDLSAFEQAMSFKEYVEKYDLDAVGAARELGLSRRNAFRLQAISKASSAFLDVLRETGISVRAADSLARLSAKEPRKAIRMARLFVQGGVTIGEIEKATTPASPRPSRSSSAARAVDLRVTAEGIHLLIGLKHRPASPGEGAEIRAALATFLWHVGIDGVAAQEPAGDAERLMQLDDDAVEAA